MMHRPDKGKILISAPFLNDIFKRSVIFLTEHNDAGSVGFILNKKLDIKLDDVVEDFPQFDANVYIGGPVEQETLNIVHRVGSVIDDSFEIGDGIYWGGNYEQIKSLISTGVLKSDDVLFFLGYSGWSPNQLDGEITTKSWYVSDIDEENLFDNDHSHLWADSLKKMGGEYSIISTFPEDPIVN